MRQLFALSESYPDLKATQLLQLARRVGEHRKPDRPAAAVVQRAGGAYNAAVLSFPASLIAGPFGFTPQAFF